MTPGFSPDHPSSGAAGTAIESAGTERRHARDIRAPAVFVSHGSPLALVEDEFKRALRHFGAHLRPPRAVLVVSAHWLGVRPLRVTGSPRPPTLHDFEGFPAWLSSVTYRCPGAPDVAGQVVSLLTQAGMEAVIDPGRGLDSGAWAPLSLMYPAARMPVVQLSLAAPVSPDEMLRVGAILARLRRQGIMLMGSGGIVHNPSRVRFDMRDPPTEPWAVAFDSWMRDRIEALDIDAILDYRARAPLAHLAAPTSEHLNPLFFVLGARLPGDVVEPLVDGFHGGNLSLRSFVLAGRRAEDHRLPNELTFGM